MRIASGLRLVVALVFGAALGCGKTYVYVDAAVPPQEDGGAPIGRPCPWGDECYNGTVCIEAVCALACAASSECPDGSDCRLHSSHPDGAVCLDSSLMGTDCALDPSSCPGALMCYSRIANDPDAFCTRECQDDRDCGARLYCQSVPSAENRDRRLCIKRKFCAPCETDDQCDEVGSVCTPDSRGGKFCSLPCVPPQDIFDPNVATCPQPWAECKDRGDGQFFCQHRYGSCVGDGTLCAPCRARADCTPGTFCYANYYSRERFCTAACAGDGTCAAGYSCFDFGNDCESDLHCYAVGGTCGADQTCSPANSPQCLVTFDLQSTINPKYPTCYPQIAGPP